MTADRYGQYYWCVKTNLAKDGEIYVHADRVEFTPTGAVIFWCDPSGQDTRTDRTSMKIQTLAIAAGQWKAVFAASCFDGHAVSAEHWQAAIIGGARARS
jgi:hypothetical protein